MVVPGARRDSLAEKLSVEHAPRTRTRRVVRRRLRARPMVVIALVALVAAAALLTYVGERATIMSLSFELAQAEQRLAAAKTEGERLELLLSQQGALDRIERVARTRLGMVEPHQMEFIVN